jgi:hypothetical protein
MRIHPTTDQLEQYSQRTLSPDVFDLIRKHVDSCVICREKCDQLLDSNQDHANLLAALLPAPEDTPYHLSYEQVAAYVDQEPGEIDAQMAESHLQVCAQCMDDVRNLREFKAENLAHLATQPLTKETDSRRGLRRIHWPAHLPLKKVAAILLAVGAIVLLALILMRSGTSDPTESGGNTDHSNSPANRNSNEASSASNQQGSKDNGIESNPLRSEAPPITVALNDGGRRITLDKQGEVVGLEHLSEALRQAVKSALTTQRLERPRILGELNSKPSILLSESGEGLPFQLLSPVGKVIQSTQPIFRWLPLKGASNYVVTVTDADLNEIAISEPLTVLEWKIAKPLEPGAIYSWQVTALKEGKQITSPVLPAPQAKFKVLEQTKVEELRRARRSYSGLHLPLSVLYAQAGLLAESEQELQMLVKANPGSRIVQNLLRSIQSLKKDRLRKRHHAVEPVSVGIRPHLESEPHAGRS